MGDQLSQIQLQVLWNRLLSVVEEQASADAQRVAQVARLAAVAREAAQAARRKRQPIFKIDESQGVGARRQPPKANSTTGNVGGTWQKRVLSGDPWRPGWWGGGTKGPKRLD